MLEGLAIAAIKAKYMEILILRVSKLRNKMIWSMTSYWFEDAETGRVPSARRVLAQPHLFLPVGLKSLQMSFQKALQFLIVDAR